MTELQKAYATMQAACGIEKGDTAKVLREWDRGEMGFEGYYPHCAMPRVVGMVGEVKCINDGSISLSNFVDDPLGTYINVPFFCLELVEKAKPELPSGVTFTADGLKVGEVYLSKDTNRRNLDL